MKYLVVFLSLAFCWKQILFAKEIEVQFATGEFPPFSSSKLKNFGLASELVISACKKAQLICKFSFFPWLRTEYLVTKGEVFGAFPYVMTDERKTKYLFSEAIFFAEVRMFYLKINANKYPSTEHFNLEKIPEIDLIGLLRGNFYKEVLTSYAKKYEESTDYPTLIKKLLNGRIDIVVENYHVMNHALKEFNSESKSEIQTINNKKLANFDNIANRIMVSKNYKNAEEILTKINIGIKKIQADGTSKKILMKYE